jgi:gentisate 1,2-dioxygenase
MDTVAVDPDVRAAWARAHVTPLWEDIAAHGGGKPIPRGHLWAWSDMEPLIRQALDLASTTVVERRVLSFRNPWPRDPGERGTIGNISAALQILKPGEVARAHRHSMNALRFVLQGSGASTIVNGKSCPMTEGDLVTTPGWAWHEHTHQGTAPIVWLDALDVPLHTYLGTGAFEPGPPNTMPTTLADAVFAAPGIVPDGVAPQDPWSPLFHYPWANAVAALAQAPTAPDGARRVRYINPLTGGPIMPMLDSFAVELNRQETRPSRSTSNAVCTVVEGTGTTRIGDEVLSWRERDVFTLPSNAWISHQTTGQARLFVCTDRDVFRRLDLLRDEVQS